MNFPIAPHWPDTGAQTFGAGPEIDAATFDLAPVSLWLEDFSGLHALFTTWRDAGVVDLAAHFAAVPALVMQSAAQMRIIKVNRRTLDLFEAETVNELTCGLDRIFGPESLKAHAAQLIDLWNGRTEFTNQTVNYTLRGRRLDVQLKGTVLPGYDQNLGRVLIAIEDITAQEAARRRLIESENYARGLFQYSPVSLWVEDFSAIKHLLDAARANGITDFRVFVDVHPEFVIRCSQEIRIIDVNQHTLTLFHAPDKETLFRRASDVFRDKMLGNFKEQLIELWDGKIHQQREVVNYTLSGQELHLHLQLSVLPGHEHDWGLVQVALTDITARKKAEAYLEFLGKHDELTKLYNRSFYVDEMNRLERKHSYPISLIVIDLNGLKTINDRLGHLAGDALLRRAGEVLGKAIEEPSHACRIGGDEFAILMPCVDAEGAQIVLDELHRLIELNNQFYTPVRLEVATGVATAENGERLEDIVRLADERMYTSKRAYYSDSARERRQHP